MLASSTGLHSSDATVLFMSRQAFAVSAMGCGPDCGHCAVACSVADSAASDALPAGAGAVVSPGRLRCMRSKPSL
jgi:hypothetical protein